MSTYVLMRILESAPRRYDVGIRLLTLGRLDKVYDRLAGHVQDGDHVLDIGCGTGALTLRAAKRGAKVKGIDINSHMLEIARRRVTEAGLAEAVELVEMGAAELDGEQPAHYDAVMCGLCLSEMSEDETRFTFREVARVLRPGGLLLIADEIKPRGFVRRLVHSLLRVPLAVLVYAVTQQTTHRVTHLPEKLGNAGFSVVSIHTNVLGDFCEIATQKPSDMAP